MSIALSCTASCPASDNFAIHLTSDSGDAPGTVLDSFTITGATLNALGLNNTPITETSVSQPLLTAGHRYWITVSSSVSYAIVWNLNSTGDVNDQATSADGGVTWFSPSGLTPGAFEVDSTVTSTVPEPGAGLLVAVGLLAAVLRRRTRQGQLARG